MESLERRVAPASSHFYGIFVLSILVLAPIQTAHGFPWIPLNSNNQVQGQGVPQIVNENSPPGAVSTAEVAPSSPFTPPSPPYQPVNSHPSYINFPYSHPPPFHTYYANPSAQYPQQMQPIQVYQNQQSPPHPMQTYTVNQAPSYQQQFSHYPPPPPPQQPGSWHMPQVATQIHPSTSSVGYGPPPVPTYGFYHPPPTPVYGGAPAGNYQGQQPPPYYYMQPQSSLLNPPPVQAQASTPAPPENGEANRDETELGNANPNQSEDVASTKIKVELNLTNGSKNESNSDYGFEQNAPIITIIEKTLENETASEQQAQRDQPTFLTTNGAIGQSCGNTPVADNANIAAGDNGSSFMLPVVDSNASREDINNGSVTMYTEMNPNIPDMDTIPEDDESVAIAGMENSFLDIETTTEQDVIEYIDS